MQQSLPLDDHYIHCAEWHDIPGEREFLMVICMTAPMSSHLMHTRWLTINTSFKWVWGWQEFEIESWDIDHMRCKYCLASTVSDNFLPLYLISCGFCLSLYNIAISQGPSYTISSNLSNCFSGHWSACVFLTHSQFWD